MSNYNPSIGYLKALGIILMVFGHTGNALQFNKFVYMFHMPLFFIVSGYCFKSKYLDMPGKFLCNKIRSLWWPYVKWSLAFLLLHNVLFHINLYNDLYGYNGIVSHLYSINETEYLAFNIVAKMHGAEQLLGGYWFLNALFFGSIIAWVTMRFVKNTLIGGGILFGACTILNKTCWHLPFFEISSQAFAASLLIVIGYAMAKYRLRPFNGWEIAAGLLFTLFGSFVWYMPMNQDSYSNRYFCFYILSATIATWCFYSLFERIRESKSVFTAFMRFVGKHTLTILTWHFLAFKLVSLMIIRIYNLPIERLAEFPVIREYAVQGWWVAYFVVAMITTCCVAYCNKWICNSWLKL